MVSTHLARPAASPLLSLGPLPPGPHAPPCRWPTGVPEAAGSASERRRPTGSPAMVTRPRRPGWPPSAPRCPQPTGSKCGRCARCAAAATAHPRRLTQPGAAATLPRGCCFLDGTARRTQRQAAGPGMPQAAFHQSKRMCTGVPPPRVAPCTAWAAAKAAHSHSPAPTLALAAAAAAAAPPVLVQLSPPVRPNFVLLLRAHLPPHPAHLVAGAESHLRCVRRALPRREGWHCTGR